MMVLISVDLPQPLGPRMATCSPTPMRRLTSRSTIFLPRITQTRSMSISGRSSDGTGQQLLQLAARQRDGIGLHAAGAGGLTGERGHVGGADSVGTERRDFEIAAQGCDPVRAIFGRGVRTAGEDARH